MNIYSRSCQILIRSLYERRQNGEAAATYVDHDQHDHEAQPSAGQNVNNYIEEEPSILDLSISDLIPWQEQQGSAILDNNSMTLLDLDTGTCTDATMGNKSAGNGDGCSVGDRKRVAIEGVVVGNGGDAVGTGEIGGDGVGNSENGGDGVGNGENGVVVVENGGDGVGNDENSGNGGDGVGNDENGVGNGENGGDGVGTGENGGDGVGNGENGGDDVGNDENGGDGVGTGENDGDAVGTGENGVVVVGTGENDGDAVGICENNGVPHGSSDVNIEEHVEKKVLKGKENWKINLKKQNWAAGKEYLGRVYDADRKYSAVEKGKREMGGRCVCTHKENMCKNFTDVDRQSIFQSVWSMSCLEPIFNSMSGVYELYKTSCTNPLSRFSFEQEFHSMNLSVFKPRKDQCDLCVSYKEGNVDDITYDVHRKRKERAQEEKSRDKEEAMKRGSKTMVLTVDLQSVLLCPMLKASALYYRTKLCVHNYTVYNVATRDVCCYVWNESEGGLSANEYASCLVDYLKDFVNDYDNFIIFSDGCTAQNRNVTLSSALCYFAIKNNKCVTQKILEKGHTQMEVDSVHGCIERQLNNKTIQIPGDYVTYIESARKANSYRVKHLKHNFFLNFSNVISLSSIRPGRNVGDPVVTDLRCLFYEPHGRIQYKLQYDNEWLDLPLCRSDSLTIVNEPQQLHRSRLKIAESKFKHLQELKSVIHADYHPYYDSLPH